MILTIFDSHSKDFRRTQIKTRTIKFKTFSGHQIKNKLKSLPDYKEILQLDADFLFVGVNRWPPSICDWLILKSRHQASLSVWFCRASVWSHRFQSERQRTQKGLRPWQYCTERGWQTLLKFWRDFPVPRKKLNKQLLYKIMS